VSAHAKPPGHLERELDYYRRECNDLGARLLRLQEEQSQAFREARRSRTVVRLVREAYRLVDVGNTAQDVAGPMLEIVVDNALCDRATLLREEPLGSGRFLVAHAIGLHQEAMSATLFLKSPPSFYHTAGQVRTNGPTQQLTDFLQMPYILWAYDRPTGHAMLIGNRSENNVSRPFEAGDQELIESALAVYLDVIYRKKAQIQLRLAKQVAEDATASKVDSLKLLATELQTPLRMALNTAKLIRANLTAAPESLDGMSFELVESMEHMLSVVDDVLILSNEDRSAPTPDAAWIAVDELLAGALRVADNPSFNALVEHDVSSRRRSLVVCVDRDQIERVICEMFGFAARHANVNTAMRFTTARRGDGSFELLVGSASTTAGGAMLDPTRETNGKRSADPLTHLRMARLLVEAHGGMLFTEGRPSGGIFARMILPVQIVRDIGSWANSGL